MLVLYAFCCTPAAESGASAAGARANVCEPFGGMVVGVDGGWLWMEE